MNKVELLDALKTKFYKVFDAKKQQEYNGISWYLVMVYDKEGNALRDVNISFYVENDGQVDEVAYWSIAEPKPQITVGDFDKDLADYLALKISQGTIKAAFQEQVDTVNKKAIAIAILEETGVLIQKRLLIDHGTDGKIRHQIIK